jgi:putative NADH-flavin reductase
VAYEIYNLENKHQYWFGNDQGITKPHEGKRFSTLCKKKNAVAEFVIQILQERKSKVAVLGGAGSFAIKMRFKLEQMLI